MAQLYRDLRSDDQLNYSRQIINDNFSSVITSHADDSPPNSLTEEGTPWFNTGKDEFNIRNDNQWKVAFTFPQNSTHAVAYDSARLDGSPASDFLRGTGSNVFTASQTLAVNTYIKGKDNTNTPHNLVGMNSSGDAQIGSTGRRTVILSTNDGPVAYVNGQYQRIWHDGYNQGGGGGGGGGDTTFYDQRYINVGEAASDSEKLGGKYVWTSAQHFNSIPYITSQGIMQGGQGFNYYKTTSQNDYSFQEYITDFSQNAWSYVNKEMLAKVPGVSYDFSSFIRMGRLNRPFMGIGITTTQTAGSISLSNHHGPEADDACGLHINNPNTGKNMLTVTRGFLDGERPVVESGHYFGWGQLLGYCHNEGNNRVDRQVGFAASEARTGSDPNDNLPANEHVLTFPHGVTIINAVASVKGASGWASVINIAGSNVHVRTSGNNMQFSVIACIVKQ